MSEKHTTTMSSQLTDRSQQGLRAAGFGILANFALVVLKGTIGVIGNSQALIADAIHSGSDLLNSCISFVSFLYSRRPADWNHPYGHERAEAFASTIAGVLIFVAGLLIGKDSISSLLEPKHTIPSIWTIVAASIALFVKLGLSQYVQGVARRTNSQTMWAEAKDHLIDVVVSLIVIVGIFIARLGITWFDSVAGICIALFILETSLGILSDTARELMDTTLTPTQRQQIMNMVAAVEGVIRVQAVAGRTIGHTILVELHVDVNPTLTVAEGARIVDAIKAHILEHIAEVRTVVVELNTDTFEPDALRLMAPPPRTSHQEHIHEHTSPSTVARPSRS